MTTTTLNAIRAAAPCHDGWTKLLKHLGKTSADDEPLPLLTVLDSNGLDDALWVLDNTECDPRLILHFGAWCAEQVLPIFEAAYPNDMRPRNAIVAARNDTVTKEDKDAAWAAGAAAGDAWAAGAAAGDAGDAWVAARTAAWAAARAAARAAAWAAGAAAGDAGDAWAAARAAAWAAARAAAWAATGYARAAAGDAAEIAARDAQELQFRKMLMEGF